MWWLISLFVGAGIVALIWWLRSRNIKVSWYEWLIGAVGLLLLLITIQNYFGSLAELRSTAANMVLLILGLPALILLVIAPLLAWRRQRAGS